MPTRPEARERRLPTGAPKVALLKTTPGLHLPIGARPETHYLPERASPAALGKPVPGCRDQWPASRSRTRSRPSRNSIRAAPSGGNAVPLCGREPFRAPRAPRRGVKSGHRREVLCSARCHYDLDRRVVALEEAQLIGLRQAILYDGFSSGRDCCAWVGHRRVACQCRNRLRRTRSGAWQHA